MTQINQQHVSIGAAIGHRQVPFLQCLNQSLGIGHDLPLQVFEFGCSGNLEGHGHGSELVGVGAALGAWEHGRVNQLGLVGIGR